MGEIFAQVDPSSFHTALEWADAGGRVMMALAILAFVKGWIVRGDDYKEEKAARIKAQDALIEAIRSQRETNSLARQMLHATPPQRDESEKPNEPS